MSSTGCSLPFLPGFTYPDVTVTRFHRSHTLGNINGYPMPLLKYTGIGGKKVTNETVKGQNKIDSTYHDPTLTYGRTKRRSIPVFLPHFVYYDKKCLTFNAFFKQGVFGSPEEFYRIRKVNIIYFLEDDTISIMEPKTLNSQMLQGRFLKRCKIPKSNKGDFWHFKDFQIGTDVFLYGFAFHIVDCDKFTKEYMASQGIVLNDREEIPHDSYTTKRYQMIAPPQRKTPHPSTDKRRRFLEYEGQILRFKAMWDDTESESGDIRYFDILYYLDDDTVMIKENYRPNDGRDPVPKLLRRTKIPKLYNDTPVTFRSIIFEVSDAEIKEFYKPIDFKVGESVFIYNRKMFLYDCDEYTRNYYRKVFCYEQKPPISVEKTKPSITKKLPPPYDGLGSLEDTFQNTLQILPRRPKKDYLKMLANADKYLRYVMKMDNPHREDSIRKFKMIYSLADNTCKIYEPQIPNSGIIGGHYLRATLLIKPGSDPLNPTYYSPIDFYIGARIFAYCQAFQIIDADLFVYRYMQQNPDKFPCEVIENIRNHMFKKGYLKEDLQDELEDQLEAIKQKERKAIGQDLIIPRKELEICLEEAESRKDTNEKLENTLGRIRQEYEKSMKHIPEATRGIKPVVTICKVPVKVDEVSHDPCDETEEAFTPKHIDTKEEISKKYYDNILRQHKFVCEEGQPVTCKDSPTEEEMREMQKRVSREDALKVLSPEMPPGTCETKTFLHSDKAECQRQVSDLCFLKNRALRDCTKYPKYCDEIHQDFI